MRYIELQLTKGRLFLTEAELTRLLAKDPVLWGRAVKRGKYILRMRKLAERQEKKERGLLRWLERNCRRA